MNDVKLAFKQWRYEDRAFWRNPASAIFTFVFPLMFMVIFNLLFSGQNTQYGRTSNFYTPAIIAFSVITACYTNIAISTVFAREAGILKRVRGTPLPPWVYLFGRVLQGIVVGLVLVVIVTAFGAVFYHVKIPTTTLPVAFGAIALGSATFCALGLAITAAVPNEDAAPAVINISIFPLLFVSDIFIPIPPKLTWLRHAADVFPIRNLSETLLSAFNPRLHMPIARHLEILAVWGVAGIVIAARTFTWDPRRS